VVFANAHEHELDGAVIEVNAFLLRYFGGDQQRLLVFNLGDALEFATIADPLVAPPRDTEWKLLWFSEAARYGGSDTPARQINGTWHIPGHSATVFAASTTA
jgi:maltooligosyltrehalose trehalohydrolase